MYENSLTSIRDFDNFVIIITLFEMLEFLEFIRKKKIIVSSYFFLGM